MLKRFFKPGFLAMIMALFVVFLTACQDEKSLKIGIIIPIEHEAMNEIVTGFKDSLSKKMPVPIKFKVANAQGDLNIQRAIIQQMQHEQYDLIVPIGTGPTQMAVSMIHKTPILSLAAIFNETDRSRLKQCNIAVVHDEIPAEKIVNFIRTLDGNIRRVVLIHSAADKIFDETKTLIQLAKQHQIEVRPIMVPSLNELYSAANNIQDAEAMLVLKDNLIVSGISTLALAAKKHHIPLITADEGSVKSGATIGLGVREQQIGIEGADIAKQILEGSSACKIPMVEMQQLTIFINQAALSASTAPRSAETFSMSTIDNVAKKLHYEKHIFE